MFTVYTLGHKISFYLTGADCTVYCDHKLLTPFFTTGMSSHVLDHWALELQQFHMKYEHIQGKNNVVVDVISRLRIYGLYHGNNSENIHLPLEDAVKHHRRDTPYELFTYYYNLQQNRQVEL